MAGRTGRWLWDLGIPILLMLVALLPRILATGALTNPDELAWLNRSVLFYDALSRKDWAATLQAFHPGVVPMWGFGGLMVARFGMEQLQVWLAANALPMADLAQVALYFPVLVSVLTVLTVYALVRRLGGREAGLYAALLLALEPYYLAFTHFIHMDMIHASLMLVAALFWINYLHPPRRWPYLVCGGVAAGLAILTRSAALYLLPFSILAGGIYFLAEQWTDRGFGLRPGSGKWLGRTVLVWLIWLAIVVATVWGLWPALWVNFASVGSRVLVGVLRSVENAHQAPAFFDGAVISGDPGVRYYGLILLFRLSPLTLALTGLNPILLALSWRRLPSKQRAAWLLGIGYAAFYLVQMALPAHKLERYMVPVVVMLSLLAGVSLTVIMRGLMGHWSKERQALLVSLRPAFVCIALLLSSIPWLRLAPDYSAYFNPLVGGGQRAIELFTVGGGLGLDQAAEYLNQKPNAADMWVPSFYDHLFQCYFVGHAARFTEDSWAGLPMQADYAVITQGQAQRDLYAPTLDFFLPRQPEYTIRINNIDYVWIYQVPHRELDGPPPIEYLSDANFEGRVRLLGYDLGQAQGKLLVNLYWQPLVTRHNTLQVTLRLTSRDGQMIAEQRDPPWAGDAAVLVWDEGLAVRDEHTVELPTYLEPGEYRLSISLGQLYDNGAERLLPMVGRTETELVIEPVELARLPQPSQLVVEGNLGNLFRMVGFDPNPPIAVTAGGTLPLSLVWETLGRTEEDYTVFVHLTGADGRLVTQADGQPLGGAYPTSFWRVGERISDPHLLSVPADLPAGIYKLQVGMYLLSTGERLPLLDVDGQVLGDTIILGSVTVALP